MFRRLFAIFAITCGVLVSATPLAHADSSETIAANASYSAKLSVGYQHACLIADGDVYCWGKNDTGQVGQPLTMGRTSTPTKVSGISNATAIAAGSMATCAIVSGGDVYCWGSDYYVAGYNGGGARYQPTKVSGISNAIAIAQGDMHTCAIVTGGSVKCWGYEAAGSLGGNSSSEVPATISGISNATAISAGANFTCVVTGSGTVQCWGANGSGQLGNASTTGSSSPVTVVVNGGGNLSNVVGVSAGNNHTCAITSTKAAYCWGDNMYGETGGAGMGMGGSLTRAVAVRSGHAAITDASDVVGVSSGEYFACIVHETGTVSCFGNNDHGQIGMGSSGTNANVGPESVLSVTGAQAVSLGRNFACATSSTAMWCWGYGADGEIGNWSFSDAQTPAVVLGFRPQTVTFAGPSNTSVTAGSAQLSASASSAGPVSFQSQTTSVCTVSGSTVTFITPGTCTVRAWSMVYGTYSASQNVDRSFTISGAAPVARSASPTSISANRATLNGTVNAGGIDTSVTFQWGTKSNLSDAASLDARTVTGMTDTDVSTTLTNLTENSTYYYRVIATNSAGTTNGSIIAFNSTRPVGITINNADEFTNKKLVTIFATGPSGSTQVVISNDGGFGSAQTFSLTDGYAEIPWTLVASRDERLPKTVYARFIQRFGTQSSTNTDDIILDTTAPVMSSAAGAATAPTSDGVTAAGLFIAAAKKGGVKLTVKASDVNSGIGKVQVKTSSGGSITDVPTGSPKATSRTVKVNTTKTKLWVRVLDRASNASKWVTVSVK